MTQPNLLDDPTLAQRILDKAEARVQTEAGVAKAERKLKHDPGAGWRLTATDALIRVARRQPELTGDDVWQELGEIDERFAGQMGCVFREAMKQQLVVKTGAFVESARPSRHRSGIRVWASKIYQG